MILAVATLISAFVLVILSKKRISQLEMFTSAVFAVVLDFIVDYLLEFRYHLYGYFKTFSADYEDLIVILGIYPLIDILFLNYYPIGKSIHKRVGYILGWSAFSVVYEWVAVQTHLFYYNGWKLIYSVPIYPLLFLILIGQFLFIKRLKAMDTDSRT
ncbi:hypothetical protein GCM10011391_39370 [Pullulanibacillus camelliae]|uniref:Uncharacterized protein n=1 Tax=Pullulanibacillus camelliae TaxID=1707096 RepID=A0A8J2YNN6_9BACL|nr:CBO0543 family protein [Pullulanibacillus camelliae]GGE56588.1 hypothetical protein GCM10011391_39370 [Pullulanibacillus camelliae]